MNRLTYGIPRPETSAAASQEGSADGMRRAIDACRRDSALIHRCMTVADRAGSSGEDRYTLLAYHALRALEDLAQQHETLLRQTTSPIWLG